MADDEWLDLCRRAKFRDADAVRKMLAILDRDFVPPQFEMALIVENGGLGNYRASLVRNQELVTCREASGARGISVGTVVRIYRMGDGIVFWAPTTDEWPGTEVMGG